MHHQTRQKIIESFKQVYYDGCKERQPNVEYSNLRAQTALIQLCRTSPMNRNQYITCFRHDNYQDILLADNQ